MIHAWDGRHLEHPQNHHAQRPEDEAFARGAVRQRAVFLEGHFTERHAGCCADVVRLAALFSIRGWCLTKMNGFPISESRKKLRPVGRDEMTAGAGLVGECDTSQN